MTLGIIRKCSLRLCGLYRNVLMPPYGSSTIINAPIGIIRHRDSTHIHIGSQIVNTQAPVVRCKSYVNIDLGPHKPNDLNRLCMQYSSESIDLRKRRLLFRSMNTGMKELDLILSEFISLNPDFVESNLSEFESFLDMETCTIYDIIMGKVSYEGGNLVIDHIKSFVESKYK